MTIFDIERALTGAGHDHAQAPSATHIVMGSGNVQVGLWFDSPTRVRWKWYVTVRFLHMDERDEHLHMLRTAPELKDAWAAMLTTKLGCITVADAIEVKP